MKKVLLVSLLVAATTLFAQRTWVVGDDATNFPVSAGIGAGPDRSVFVADLGIHTGTVTNTNMGQVEVSSKTFNGVTYPNRFKYNGGSYPSSADTQLEPASGTPLTYYYTPTQRFLTIKVTGPGTIKIQGLTGSSGSTRRLFVTNGSELIGTMVFPAGSEISEGTVTYTGGEAILYLITNAAINLYRIEASSATTHTSLSSGVNGTLTDKVISFNGKEIVNNKKVNVDVFNVLGKLIASSNTNISTANFPKGVYLVRPEGVNDVLKISIQ